VITLYERSDCPFCWKVRIALAELGVDYKSVASKLGEPHPEVRRLSPVHTVPVLVDGDVVIWESAIVLDYLDATYGQERLLPADPAQQTQVRLLHAYSDKCVGPALRDLVFEKRSRPRAEWDQQLIESSEQRWRDCQQWLEDNAVLDAATRPAVLNAAECALAARGGVAAAYGSPIGREFPALFAWFERVKERASWDAAYPTSFISPDA